MSCPFVEVSSPWLEFFDRLQPEPSWSFRGLSPSQTNYGTHGYHRYPAKFIPQLAARLILSSNTPKRVTL